LIKRILKISNPFCFRWIITWLVFDTFRRALWKFTID
jgi:hypothetical protein